MNPVSDIDAPAINLRKRDIVDDLQRLFVSLSGARRRQLRVVLFLSMLGAIADVLTVGALIPFLAILAGEAADSPYAIVRSLVDLFSSIGQGNLFANAMLFFVAAALLAGLVKIWLNKARQSFVFQSSHDLTLKVFESAISQPYSYHISTNSSELIAVVSKVKSITMRTIAPLLALTSQAVTSILLLATLVFINPLIAFVAFVGLIMSYFVVTRLVTGALRRNSETVSRLQSKRVQTMQEALGSIRELILGRSHGFFLGRFEDYDRQISRARISTSLIGNIPRHIVETLAIILIAAFAYFYSLQGGGLSASLPMLGALAFGVQKLIPAVQSSYSSWAGVKGNHHALMDVIDMLKLPNVQPPSDPNEEPLSFTNAVRFEGVSFVYPDRRASTIKNAEVVIARGARVGIIGRTGGGKSTFADLMMGLLLPTTGRIVIDEAPLTQENAHLWQKRVAHVSQEIYLSDSSIRQNIAFGEAESEVDVGRLNAAIAAASLSTFIAELPDGVESMVGENGVRLSGGQKQRIAIARALYRKADVLIFDEATSALDTQTEKEVLDPIRALGRDLTVVTIAHRASAIDWCDVIYAIENGQVTERQTAQ